MMDIPQCGGSSGSSGYSTIKNSPELLQEATDSQRYGFRLVRARKDGHDIEGPIPAPKLATPVGFLMLFTDDWYPVKLVNFFSMERIYKPMRTARWQNSQKAAAHDLTQWWTFISENKLDWHAVTSDDISDYASLMADTVSPSTNLQYSASTVRRRVGSVVNFYSWAYKHGLIADFASKQTTQDSLGVPIGPKFAVLPHLKTARALALKPRIARGRVSEADPRPFKMNDLARVLQRLGPPIFSKDQSLLPWEKGTHPRRDRLVAEVAYHTGMRGDEIASISIPDVLNQARGLNSNLRLQQFVLVVRTKGRPNRKVIVSSVILRALVKYYETERAEAVDRAQRNSFSSPIPYREPTQLFVNGINANLRDVGRPISPETPSRAFTKAVFDEGLTFKRQCFRLDPESGDVMRGADGKPLTFENLVAAYTFHSLRHTFAVMFYKSEILRGNSEPWEKLKQLLGHSNSETTRKIYLKHVEVEEGSISDAVAHSWRMALYGLQ